jgi:hypothetical protein
MAGAGAAGVAMSMRSAGAMLAARVSADAAVMPGAVMAGTVMPAKDAAPRRGGGHDEIALVGVGDAWRWWFPAVSPHLAEDATDPRGRKHRSEDHEL